MDFLIRIADVGFGIHTLHNKTYAMCADYITDDAPDFEICITQSDIDAERQASIQCNIFEGKAVVNYPDDYLETLAVYRKICDCLVNRQVVLFHSSAVAVDGYAYLFAAPSGTGKSTHVRLWREFFGDRAVMINDDKPLIKVTDGGAVVFGTPWNGKHKLGQNLSAPIRAICFLERGEKNEIVEINSGIFEKLVSQTYRPFGTKAMVQTMTLVSNLSRCVKFYKLKCNMDIEAAELAYNAMAPKEST